MAKPAARRDQAIFGKVKSRSDLRPNVSIVQMAGLQGVLVFRRLKTKDERTHQANTKLTRPNPKDAIRAALSLAPATLKTVEE